MRCVSDPMMKFPFLPLPNETTISAHGVIARGGNALSRVVIGERVVLSRGLCHFETMPTPPGPRNSTAIKAAELAARTRSPFADADFRLVWGERKVGIWSWAKEVTRGLGNSEAVAIPESACHAPSDGVVLRECLDGFEAQAWRSDQMHASRWWPTYPEKGELDAFARGAGFAAQDGYTFEKPPMREPPLEPRAFGLQRLSRFSTKDAVAVALVAVVAPLAFLAANNIKLSFEVSAAEDRLTSLAAISSQTVEARERAIDISNDIQAYRDALQHIHPAEPVALFSEIASDRGARLEYFSVSQNEIELTASAPEDLSPVSLIESLESETLFENAQIESSNREGEWVISSDLQAGHND